MSAEDTGGRRADGPGGGEAVPGHAGRRPGGGVPRARQARKARATGGRARGTGDRSPGPPAAERAAVGRFGTAGGGPGPAGRVATGVAACGVAVAVGAGAWLVAGGAGLLVVGVGGALLALLALGRARIPAAPSPPAPKARPVGRTDEEFARYRTLHGRLSWGQVSARHFDGTTRPVLERIAAARLMERRGIDLVRHPEAARAALGDDELWELVRPGRPPSDDSHAPAPPPAVVARLVDRLEEL